MNHFGEQLRILRENRKMSVNQLAMYSGVSAAGISRIENGKRGVPKPLTIKKLARALKVPYEDLMLLAGYIEQEKVHEMKPKYDSILKIYQTVLQKDVEHLPIFDGDQWETLTAQDISQLNQYFLTLINQKKANK
ncbi:helix-turn-helix domain-containing protein [Bacillus altitudinis]|uniref:helix-turn-helix domain-containing protein n=1 Tax=Bacillus altitudinis TaxID=293387 RepID=UPI001BA9EC39|nr:helix-turn-helix transcriptional regulator [Bacillus altitudinis]MBR0631847.1 helix-turn-helix transcriptional regulator [Bacillus altitudinis C101]